MSPRPGGKCLHVHINIIVILHSVTPALSRKLHKGIELRVFAIIALLLGEEPGPFADVTLRVQGARTVCASISESGDCRGSAGARMEAGEERCNFGARVSVISGGTKI